MSGVSFPVVFPPDDNRTVAYCRRRVKYLQPPDLTKSASLLIAISRNRHNLGRRDPFETAGFLVYLRLLACDPSMHVFHRVPTIS